MDAAATDASSAILSPPLHPDGTEDGDFCPHAAYISNINLDVWQRFFFFAPFL